MSDVQLSVENLQSSMGGGGTISDRRSRSFHLTVFKDEKNLTGSACPVLDMNKICDSLACAQNSRACPHYGNERCALQFAWFSSYPYPFTVSDVQLSVKNLQPSMCGWGGG